MTGFDRRPVVAGPDIRTAQSALCNYCSSVSPRHTRAVCQSYPNSLIRDIQGREIENPPKRRQWKWGADSWNIYDRRWVGTLTFLALHILQPVLVLRCGRLEHGAATAPAAGAEGGAGALSMLDTDGESGGMAMAQESPNWGSDTDANVREKGAVLERAEPAEPVGVWSDRSDSRRVS